MVSRHEGQAASLASKHGIARQIDNFAFLIVLKGDHPCYS